MIKKFVFSILMLQFSTSLLADAASVCEGKLPWNLPATSDVTTGSQSETLIVLNLEESVATVVCYCEGPDKSHVTVVNSGNKQVVLYKDACSLITDREIKINNGNDEGVSGAFYKYTPAAKPKSKP